VIAAATTTTAAVSATVIAGETDNRDDTFIMSRRGDTCPIKIRVMN
jgi:hypothetical protein